MVLKLDNKKEMYWKIEENIKSSKVFNIN